MRLLGASFSPEDVALMERVLDATAAPLAPDGLTSFQQALLADRLRRAASGERDPCRLSGAR